MTRRLLLLLLPLLACAPVTPPQTAPVAPAVPQLAATGTAQRVVYVSFDALGAELISTQQNLYAFSALEREGAGARVIPINPTLTGPAHATMITGADPQVHGVVSNRFHVPGTPPDRAARGFESAPDVETIIEAARRQGKRVGAVPFPGVLAQSRHASDFGMSWPMALAPSRVVNLTRADFHREWVPPTWTQTPTRRTSFSPIMRARAEWAIPEVFRADVDVVAYDTTDDSRENYDVLIVETDEREIAPDARGWFALSAQTPEGLAGSWSKVLEVDPALANVRIYWGAITRNVAWPSSFHETLDREVGFWPGAPEEGVEVDRALFVEQAERLTDFMTRAQTMAIRTQPFDLLLAYQPGIDEMLHTNMSEESVRTAFAMADRALGAIRESIDPARDALVVSGDHGMHAIDTELRLNALLAERGFAPRWRAFTSGHVGHLYRFEGPDDSDAVVDMLTSSGLFELVEKRHADSHRNSGDIIATSKPNVALSMSLEAPVTRKPRAAGNHGTLNSNPAMHTVLFATGAGTPRGPLGEVSQTRIARFLSELLGIAPPAAAQ